MELYAVIEAVQLDWILLLCQVVLGLEDGIDALHGGKPLGDVVASLGEFLQRVYQAVEYHKVEDERTRIDHRRFIEYQRPAEPKHCHDEHRAEEFAHRVCELLAHRHAPDDAAVGVVGRDETVFYLLLRVERHYDPQPAKCLVNLRHDVAPPSLRLE